MIPIIDFQKRANNGPITNMQEFDLMLTRKARELVKKYGLKLDINNIIATDETADAVFNAAVEFLAEVGVYHSDTQRIIKWDKEEILAIAADYKNNPRVLEMGKNADSMTLKQRTSKDSRPPVLWAAVPIYDQKTFGPSIEMYVQEAVIQGFSKAGGVSTINGIESSKGTPGEIYCSLWEAEAQTEALTKAGRPDLFRGYMPTATSLGAALASMGPGRFEAHNCMVGIHIMPELKINWEKLNIALAFETLGITPWTSAMSMVGGLCGGPGGAAMGAVANLLAQLSYGHGTWGSIALTEISGTAKTRGALTAYSAAHRAMERNVGLATGTPCVESAVVASHEEGIIAGTMIAIAVTASGGALDWYGGSSPLVSRVHADVMKNVAGMEADKVNDMLQALSKKIEDIAAQTGESKLTFNEQLCGAVYNLETLKPKPEHLAAVKSSVEMMKACGVPVSDDLLLD